MASGRGQGTFGGGRADAALLLPGSYRRTAALHAQAPKPVSGSMPHKAFVASGLCL